MEEEPERRRWRSSGGGAGAEEVGEQEGRSRRGGAGGEEVEGRESIQYLTIQYRVSLTDTYPMFLSTVQSRLNSRTLIHVSKLKLHINININTT